MDWLPKEFYGDASVDPTTPERLSLHQPYSKPVQVKGEETDPPDSSPIDNMVRFL